jgi:hypothetical protein
LFAKNDSDSETRSEHPEFFLTIHDSLFCGFCVATEILFEDKEKATSLWTLMRKSRPEVATGLSEKIRAHEASIEKIEAIRHQVCAHRWRSKTPQEVFAEVHLRVNMMTDIVGLARFAILELVGEISSSRRAELERQQLSDHTIQIVGEDADKVIQAFRLLNCLRQTTSEHPVTALLTLPTQTANFITSYVGNSCHTSRLDRCRRSGLD